MKDELTLASGCIGSRCMGCIVVELVGRSHGGWQMLVEGAEMVGDTIGPSNVLVCIDISLKALKVRNRERVGEVFKVACITVWALTAMVKMVDNGQRMGVE